MPTARVISTLAVSVRVPVVDQKLACDAHTKIWQEQKLACDAHTLLGVEHAPTVPPESDANETDCVGGDFAATLEDIAMKLCIEKDSLPSLHCS